MCQFFLLITWRRVHFQGHIPQTICKILSRRWISWRTWTIPMSLNFWGRRLRKVRITPQDQRPGTKLCSSSYPSQPMDNSSQNHKYQSSLVLRSALRHRGVLLSRLSAGLSAPAPPDRHISGRRMLAAGLYPQRGGQVKIDLEQPWSAVVCVADLQRNAVFSNAEGEETHFPCAVISGLRVLCTLTVVLPTFCSGMSSWLRE